eukprot:8825222-Alexandrium_andersonii.AAC.1
MSHVSRRSLRTRSTARCRPAPNEKQHTFYNAAHALQHVRADSTVFEQFPARPLRGGYRPGAPKTTPPVRAG